jgi:hypothetical protein
VCLVQQQQVQSSLNLGFFLGFGHVWRINGLHANDMISAVNMQVFAGCAAA